MRLVFKGGGGGGVGAKSPPSKTSRICSFSKVEVVVDRGVDKKSPPLKTSIHCSFSTVEAVVVLAKSPPSKTSRVRARFLKVVVVLGGQNTQ